MSLAKMFGVVAIGMPLTLFSTAQVAFLVRKYVQTEMLDTPTADALPPFGRYHFITWGELSALLFYMLVLFSWFLCFLFFLFCFGFFLSGCLTLISYCISGLYSGS